MYPGIQKPDRKGGPMSAWIKKLYGNDMIRYIFFGGCTTLVNLVSFYIFRLVKVPLNVANFISIWLALLFAYVVNSLFVFHDDCSCLKDHIRPFGKFLSARLVTMAVELGGVWLLVQKLMLHEMLGKAAVQFIVIVLNYVFSKFFVFTTKSNKK